MRGQMQWWGCSSVVTTYAATVVCNTSSRKHRSIQSTVHHPHLDSTPSKRAGGYHSGIPGVAGGAMEQAQTPRGRFFSEVMVSNTFDPLMSPTKTCDVIIAAPALKPTVL